MELGINSFGDVRVDPATGRQIEPAKAMKELINQIELADQLGLDVFGLGEHHRAEFLISSPAVVLAAAAARTKRIKLGSAVTVLSSDDPVRVFQDFATLDLLSEGRAEILAGRGSFIESFPLFGYDLDDYDALFEEKLDLLLKLRDQEIVNWAGHFRPSIPNLPIYPQPFQKKLPIWLAVGGTPKSVVRAATIGLPLALAIIGGMPSRFVPMADLYRRTAGHLGTDPSTLAVSVNSIGFLADTSQAASNEFYPGYAEAFSRIGKERGWPPTTRAQYEAAISAEGALLVGSPQQVIDKILMEKEIFNLDRFVIQMSTGAASHSALMRSIELFGAVVAPAVK
jgi:probable LLM family oxidoreductase